MKNISINSFLLSLLALFTISILFTSCAKEEILPDSTTAVDVNDLQENTTTRIYVLPYGYDDKSAEEISAYLESISEETWDKLEKAEKIVNYLYTNNKIDEAKKHLKEGDIIDTQFLEKYYSTREVEAFNNFELQEVNKRGCTAWRWVSSYSITYVTVWSCRKSWYYYYHRVCNGFWNSYKSVFVGNSGC